MKPLPRNPLDRNPSQRTDGVRDRANIRASPPPWRSPQYPTNLTPNPAAAYSSGKGSSTDLRRVICGLSTSDITSPHRRPPLHPSNSALPTATSGVGVLVGCQGCSTHCSRCNNCASHVKQAEDSTLVPAWTKTVPCHWKLLRLAEGEDVGGVYPNG